MPDNPMNEVELSKVLALLAEIDQRMREGFAVVTQEQKTVREDQQALGKRVEEGFTAVAQEQQIFREDQQALSERMEDGFTAVAQEQQIFREDQQALSERMKEGFAAVAQEQQIFRADQQTLSNRMDEGFTRVAQELNNRMDEGFAAEAQKRETLENKFDDFKNWLMREIPENAHILSNMIDRVGRESQAAYNKLQNDFLQIKNDAQKDRETAQVFRSAMMETVEHIRRVLERQEHRAVSTEEFAEFKREQSVHNKDVQQRLNRLETARSLN